ncbi:HAD family phosphatase [uncultured Deefgea sp.]|uniref:HAD family hydrolase n=1 Tax=uncultured Deefgea sp. TaxID=1304914 RepID=UPI0026397021|nr:HAD family phosphatase [uncultured Deefgea sp.]
MKINTNPNKIAAAIFDMDGLLIDSERMALSCWHDAAEQLGHAIAAEIPLGMIGMHSSKTEAYLHDALGAHFPVAQLRAATHEIYLARSHETINLRPGVIELLDYLKHSAIPCAVATSTKRAMANHHLSISGLWPYFQFAVCGDEITHPKPAPDIYLKVIGQLGVPAAHCVVFEDSNFGAQAGHAAGCRVIMVPDLLPASAQTQALGIEMVDSLRTAKQILEQSQAQR